VELTSCISLDDRPEIYFKALSAPERDVRWNQFNLVSHRIFVNHHYVVEVGFADKPLIVSGLNGKTHPYGNYN
jgi:hypothetical protein